MTLAALFTFLFSFSLFGFVFWLAAKSRRARREGALGGEFGQAELEGVERSLATEPGAGVASVQLFETGRKRIAVIKEVRDATGLGLREAKELADRAGGVEILSRVSLARARRVEAKLEAAGATARVVVHEDEPRVAGVVAARGGQSRCPYCHEDAQGDDLVACTSCMARHHEGCWDEHTQCAACGNPERFSGIEHTGGRERRQDSLKE